ncbi:hypothetical protein, partial [Staphylococcus epidermidis]|uniref:hypothetical protein n=1 Tax=Staphylococcus epidermidis TaxID=1282 RepID=UPI0011A3AB05
HLKQYLPKNPNHSILLIPLQTLYPFPQQQIKELLKSLPHLQNLSSLQQQPKNQPPCLFLYPYLKPLVANKYHLT